jgi:voltage-dependent anion channel protein 2
MTEYVKVEKIVPRFPPPAFSDIAKASNDVCCAHKAPDSDNR